MFTSILQENAVPSLRKKEYDGFRNVECQTVYGCGNKECAVVEDRWDHGDQPSEGPQMNSTDTMYCKNNEFMLLFKYRHLDDLYNESAKLPPLILIQQDNKPPLSLPQNIEPSESNSLDAPMTFHYKDSQKP